jgi:hypothetical protein
MLGLWRGPCLGAKSLRFSSVHAAGLLAWRFALAKIAFVGLCVFPAQAASQGGVGALSMGSLTVSLEKRPQLFITGNLDVAVDSSGDWAVERLACIVGQGVTGYRVMVADDIPSRFSASLDGQPLHARFRHTIAGSGSGMQADGATACGAGGEDVRLRLSGGAGSGSAIMTLLIAPE